MAISQDPSELAYRLLVELLAYQFAYPVKWIDTQDVLLANPDLRRIVEIGPSSILVNMAKKTNEAKYKTMSAALSLNRALLATTKDVAQVRYHYEKPLELETTPSNETDHSTLPNVAAPPLIQPQQPAPIMVPQPQAVAMSVEDVPVTSLEIIRAVIAIKLKKPVAQILDSKSLKDLASGKSTLQNEWVGDLTAEFGSIPDKPEDLSLASLAEKIERKIPGHLGKTTSTLVSRWLSSTMPAGFGLPALRTYVKSRWGMGEGRQLSVILVALANSTAASSSRFDTVEAAQAFVDGAVTEYAKSCGLELQQVSAGAQSQDGAAVSVDPAALKGLSEQVTRLASIQHSSLSKYLGVDDEQASGMAELETTQRDQQTQLDLWLSEFGPDFQAGIKPSFDERKMRHFDFSWNQARVDIVKLLLGSTLEPMAISDAELLGLADKCDASCLELVRRLTSHAALVSGAEDPMVILGRLLAKLIRLSLGRQPLARFQHDSTRPTTDFSADGDIRCLEIPRVTSEGAEASYAQVIQAWGASDREAAHQAAVCLKTKSGATWTEDSEMTTLFMKTISTMINEGINLETKVVLVTGAGKGSIGAEIVKKLLMSGATVIVTTSRAISEAQEFYREIYKKFGARGSELFVVPFNQGSVADCQNLVHYVFKTLKRHIDIFIPLAAIPEQGIEINGLGERSELAHRLMMTNVLRLIGYIVEEKGEIHGQQTQVLLPLSPNHGIFGGDGLYSESKLGLEGLLNRVSSEAWGDKISICGVVIGWTRGTGLMSANDIVAEAVESHGALTFTTAEMALNMLALLTPAISDCWEDDAVLADFSGCLGDVANLKEVTTRARETVRVESETRKMILEEDRLELSMTKSNSGEHPVKKAGRCRPKIEFPTLPHYARDLQPLSHLQGMASLESTVVVVGFSEFGPWGSARTRWQMEAYQQLSPGGYVEMAWLMGLIKRNEKVSEMTPVGWVDSKSGESLNDVQICRRFGRQIMQNSGIRLIEPETAGFDASRKEYLQEVAIEDDMPEFDADAATAEALKLKHGKHAIVARVEGQDVYRVRIKAGARILLPKSVKTSSSVVAGLLPKGWSPARLGISEDIISQVDPVTLYALYCTAEAFLSAGIEDAMELFKYMHVSEVGNFIGSSLGGTEKNRDMFRNVYMDKQVQGDVLQETNPNTPAAWVNMILLGASGPIKTPVGACATSLESLDGAVDSITSGKTKLCLVGGVDGLHEDETFAFSTMKATVDSGKQLEMGRLPTEMSRPTAETRAGFLEAEGGGVQILCSAKVALEMGLPIYAIVAGSTLASDKIGRSVPAPGQGLLTFAREAAGAECSPYLDVWYRRGQMEQELANLLSVQTKKLTDDVVLMEDSKSWASSASSASTPRCDEVVLANRISAIRRQWTTGFRTIDPDISPMRAALATWGLTIDDITIVSLHGTSTKANDLNEPETLQKQMKHLGRQGPPIIAMCQKSVTGHPKAPAAAWMLNGCLQAIMTGVVPGNYACDNIDSALAEFDHLVFPSETLKVGEIKAFLLNSFGFGQKGAQMIGVAPKYLFAALGEEEYLSYAERCGARKRMANRAFAKAIMTNSIVRAHDHSAYRAEDTLRVLLDPLARAERTSVAGVTRFEFGPQSLVLSRA